MQQASAAEHGVMTMPLPWDPRTPLMQVPRHVRGVYFAARRAASLDERGMCDEWVVHNLKRCRAAALQAGYTQEQIDNWTVEGMTDGRRL